MCPAAVTRCVFVRQASGGVAATLDPLAAVDEAIRGFRDKHATCKFQQTVTLLNALSNDGWHNLLGELADVAAAQHVGPSDTVHLARQFPEHGTPLLELLDAMPDVALSLDGYEATNRAVDMFRTWQRLNAGSSDLIKIEPGAGLVFGALHQYFLESYLAAMCRHNMLPPAVRATLELRAHPLYPCGLLRVPDFEWQDEAREILVADAHASTRVVPLQKVLQDLAWVVQWACRSPGAPVLVSEEAGFFMPVPLAFDPQIVTVVLTLLSQAANDLEAALANAPYMNCLYLVTFGLGLGADRIPRIARERAFWRVVVENATEEKMLAPPTRCVLFGGDCQAPWYKRGFVYQAGKGSSCKEAV